MQTYTHYKESGLDWIGQIPEHWEISKLGNILKPYSVKNKAHLPLLSITREKGVILRGDDPAESNHNFIPDDLSGYKHIKKGQFGMNKMKAWQGSYGYSNFEGIVSPAYYIFDISDKLYGDYFSKTIRSNAFIPFFIKASDGVRIGQWDLSKPRMKEIPFYIPPIHEQEAIANFLDQKTAKIDALVQTKEQQIEKLKELRQAKIHQAVTKGLDAHAPTKDSGIEWIGQIPEHWEVKRLKNVGEFINGYAFNSESFLSEGIKVMKISNIQTMKTDWSDLSCVDVKYFEALEKFRVLQGDLVFALTRPIISTGIKATIVFENEKILINQRNAILRTKGDFDIKWLYYIILDSSFIQEFDNQIDKTGQQPNISTYNIGNIFIPFPRKKDIEQIVTYLDEVTGKIDQAIAQKQEQITKLKEYKQSLINEVVTGKVKVC